MTDTVENVLDPMTVDELEMDLTVQKSGLRERDLSAHLSNARAQQGGKPLETVRYQLTSESREALRDRGQKSQLGSSPGWSQLSSVMDSKRQFYSAVIGGNPRGGSPRPRPR